MLRPALVCFALLASLSAPAATVGGVVYPDRATVASQPLLLNGAGIRYTLQLSELFVTKKNLKAGEHFSVEWRPGTGTQILVNGEAMGKPIAEPEFFNAMLRIWLGPKPADDTLKAQLLGQRIETPPGQIN
jgi:hypothetical protein